MIGTALTAAAAITTLTGQNGGCNIAKSNTCDANPACTWCESFAVASACRTLEEAAQLPAGVFECHSKQVNGSCNISTQGKCDSQSDCTWCNSFAVAPACRSLEDAAKLPAGVFECDVKVAESNGVDRKAAVEFISGFLLEAVDDEHLAAVDSCVGDAKYLITDIKKIIADLKVGHSLQDILQVVMVLGDVLKHTEADIADCKGVKGDWKRIESWSAEFKHPKQLIPSAIARIAGNYTYIIADVMDIVAKSKTGGYKSIGEDVAKVAEIVLGPIPATAVNGGSCDYSTQSKCDGRYNCTWCKSFAVADACRTLTEAAQLPAGVFECDKANSLF